MLIAMFTRNADSSLSVMDLREPMPRYKGKWFSRTLREFARYDDIAEIRIYEGNYHPLHTAAYRVVARR